MVIWFSMDAPHSSSATSCLCRWSNEAPAVRSQFWKTLTYRTYRLVVTMSLIASIGELEVAVVLLEGHLAGGEEIGLVRGALPGSGAGR